MPNSTIKDHLLAFWTHLESFLMKDKKSSNHIIQNPSPTLKDYLAVWADVVSFLLLIITILIDGGVDPRRRVWERRPLRTFFLRCFISINIIFSLVRVILEGIWVKTGPREFLLLSVIYCARWLWLFFSVFKYGSRPKKAIEVACALRELKTIRLGTSTKIERNGLRELVIRRGASTSEARALRGDPYWRGIEDTIEFSEDRRSCVVQLVEKELHSNTLDEIGTVGFKRKIWTDSLDGLYKKFYHLVMTVDEENPELVVDYTPFLEEFIGVRANTRQARRVAATDESALGNVARRVAADACHYIWYSDAVLHTTNQINFINECLETAARTYLEGDCKV